MLSYCCWWYLLQTSLCLIYSGSTTNLTATPQDYEFNTTTSTNFTEETIERVTTEQPESSSENVKKSLPHIRILTRIETPRRTYGYWSNQRNKAFINRDTHRHVPNTGGQYPSQVPYTGGQYPSQVPHTGGQYPSRVRNTGGQYPSQVPHTGGQYPSWVPHTGGQYPSRVQNTGVQYPSQVPHNGRQYPSRVINTGGHYSGQLPNTGGQYPSQVPHTGRQYPSRVPNNRPQYPRQIPTNRAQYPRQVINTGVQYPIRIPNNRMPYPTFYPEYPIYNRGHERGSKTFNIYPSGKAEPVSDVCPQIGAQILINGLPCPDAIDRFGLHLCYTYEQYYKSCCEKCLQVKEKDKIGCEYGDHSFKCTTLPAYQCYEYYNRAICCKTCKIHREKFKNRIQNCEYGDMTPRCKFITPAMCYQRDIERLCCETCPKFKKEDNKLCPYGDQSNYLCNAVLLDISRCYAHQTESICCETCSKVKKSEPDCPYGDHSIVFNSAFGNLNCEQFVRVYTNKECSNPVIKSRCCASCGA